MGILDYVLSAVNVIAALWTVVGGPYLGFRLHEKMQSAGRSTVASVSAGTITGLVSTLVIVTSSFFVWTYIGVPAAWYPLLKWLFPLTIMD